MLTTDNFSVIHLKLKTLLSFFSVPIGYHDIFLSLMYNGHFNERNFVNLFSIYIMKIELFIDIIADQRS